MDFTTALPDPLDFTSGPKNYPSMTIDSFSIGDTTYWTAHGEVEIGGIPRFTKGSIESGVFTSLEISTLHPDDTFLGIPLALRPIRFQNQLSDIGITSLNDGSSVTLPGRNVSFYIFENELASICWMPSPAPDQD